MNIRVADSIIPKLRPSPIGLRVRVLAARKATNNIEICATLSWCPPEILLPSALLQLRREHEQELHGRADESDINTTLSFAGRVAIADKFIKLLTCDFVVKYCLAALYR